MSSDLVLRDALAAYARGDRESAVAQLRQAIALDAGHAASHHYLGSILAAGGHYQESLIYLGNAVTLAPQNVDSLSNYGMALNCLGRSADALMWLDRAVAVQPTHTGALNNRGLALGRLGRHLEALACYDRAVAREPSNPDIWSNRGATLHKLRRFEEALSNLDKAIGLNSRHVDAHHNRGLLLLSLEDPMSALECWKRVLQLNPRHIDALNGSGVAYRRLGALGEAMQWYARALAIDPGHVDALYNRSLILLAQGNLAEGFRGHEYRWQSALRGAKLQPGVPLWLGNTSVNGKTVLLHHEQGFGDTLQFVRYAPMVAQLGAHVILRVPEPLKSLVSRLDADLEVVSDEVELPACDFHCPLMSLPLAFGTDRDTIPANVPYLRAKPEAVAHWQRRLGPRSKKRVGIVWAGRQYPPVNNARDMNLESLLPLLGGDAEFVSLQKEVPAGDRTLLASVTQLSRLGEQVTDFEDTAGLIANLDLVIGVDTSVIHLAAAMGTPTWLLNRYAGCWRWLTDREDSPWYPSLRIFRQPHLGDWSSVVASASGALSTFLR